jgi:hypothetical protein
LDEGIAASSAERALAAGNTPQVVITMPAYRAETTRNGRSPISRPELPIVSSWSAMRVPTTVIGWHGRSASTFTFYAENLGYGGTRLTCYTEALRKRVPNGLKRGAAEKGEASRHFHRMQLTVSRPDKQPPLTVESGADLHRGN